MPSPPRHGAGVDARDCRPPLPSATLRWRWAPGTLDRCPRRRELRDALRVVPRRRAPWAARGRRCCPRTSSGCASRPRPRRSRGGRVGDADAGVRRQARRSPRSPRWSHSSTRRQRRRRNGARPTSAPRASSTSGAHALPAKPRVCGRSDESLRRRRDRRPSRDDPRRRHVRADRIASRRASRCTADRSSRPTAATSTSPRATAGSAKYDIWNLTLVAEVRAGINTRNLAVSSDGRYVAGRQLPAAHAGRCSTPRPVARQGNSRADANGEPRACRRCTTPRRARASSSR